MFEDSTTALFETSNKDQQAMIDNILIALGQTKVDWTTSFPHETNAPFFYEAPLLLT